MEIFNGVEKIGKPYAAIYNDNHGGYDGHYVCKHGIITIDHNEFSGKWYTLLKFPFNGKMYRRNINGKMYTKIGLARIAGKFVKEILINYGNKN